MRLTCPNCGAQYEVPVEVIPEGGRDVQCSNCSNTWYQAHPDDPPAPSGDPDLAQPQADVAPQDDVDPEPSLADTRPKAPVAPNRHPAPPRRTSVEEYDDDGDNAPSMAPPRDAIGPATARARGLDPSVAEVLREEAARESRRRAAEFSSLESQPELGLDGPSDDDETARRKRPSRDRTPTPPGDTAPEKPVPPATPEPAQGPSSSRRDLLPDVEEINQTLRSSRERRAVETPQGRAPMEDEPSGFRRGFALMLVLAILLATLYIFAPQIGDLLPFAEPTLASYVAGVDQLRLWLDAQVTSLLLALDGLGSEPSAPAEN